MGAKQENGDEWIDEIVMNYLRGEAASLEVSLQDLYRKFAKAAAKIEKWLLPKLGPYTLDFISNGRYMAAAGQKGHLAIVDMKTLNLIKEVQVRESVHDVVYLHNEVFFAAAQKKYPYIYNCEGAELHCLKDVTMGEMVGNFWSGSGRTDVMQVNPNNGVVVWNDDNVEANYCFSTCKDAVSSRTCLVACIPPNGHLMATSGKEKK